MVDILNTLDMVTRRLSQGEESVRLEGEGATLAVENALLEVGYKVVRDVCPILLRQRLTVSLS